ncbi:MAG: DUF305 domain-containing protein [Gemmatimonadota bacterium]
MTDIRRSRLLALCLAAAPLMGCASGGSPASETAPPPDPSLSRLEAIYQARADSARMNVSPADVAFMTGMIHHHAQALVMSGWAPTNGASASIRTLTARIINAQKDEIGIMQRWLRERGRPVPEVGAGGEMEMGGHAMHMPGMLSEQQLAELKAARGGDYDRLFLTYMIQHHQGAVTMVHELFATDGAAQDEFVFKLASDIQVDQTTEVARMQRMLDALPPARDR